MLRAGCNIRHIQSILGHRRLASTEIYTKVEKEDLKGVVDACHPRKWSHG
jgi:site-specific recombinase XerD